MTALETPIPTEEPQGLSPEYARKKPYLKEYYGKNKRKMIFQTALNDHIKRQLGKQAVVWICLGCDTLTKFDNSLAARRHVQILGHTVYLKFYGDRTVCLHKCKRCGVISSCQKDEHVHGPTFEIDGPCHVCKCIEERPQE